MTIIHLTSGNHFRGGERQLVYLHKGLLKRQCNSILLCAKNKGIARAHPQLTLSPVLFGVVPIPIVIYAVYLCKKHRADILHCSDSRSLIFGAIATLFVSARLVATRRVMFRLRKNLLSRWKYVRCSAVVAISQAVAKKCAEVVPAKSIHVIHSGVDLAAPLLEQPQAKAHLGLDTFSGNFLIGTVAHFSGEKNLDLLLHLARFLEHHHPQARLVCVGPTDTAGTALLASCKSIVLTGLIENPLIYYRAFDLYVSTSRSEGLGTALLDAVVHDIATVATNAGGTCDIYPPGSHLVAPGDRDDFVQRVSYCIEHPDACRQAALQAGAYARERFGTNVMIDSVLKLYRSLSANAGADSPIMGQL